MNWFRRGCIKYILTVVLIYTLVLPTQASAQYRVVETGKNVVQNTITAANSALTSAATQGLNIKEYSLDGIAYGITRTIIQSMVRSIVNWINSGFQGSPAFVTDLQQHLQNVADQVVSDTLMGSDLAFLCSPFQLDVKIAIATEYNKRRDGYQPECTLNDVTNNIDNFLAGSFQEGGWQSWFELTQGETNDPNSAYFDAQLEVYAAIRNAQGEEIELLDWGDGFLSFKVCSDTQVQSGAQTDCDIVTPGQVIADQLNETLSIGGRGLIEADEINEILGALLAQLAQQALTGVYGLLGMGGNSSYTDYSYGADGTSSYLDALAVEQPVDDSVASSTRAIAFDTSIESAEEYLDLQYEIVSRVDTAEANYETRTANLYASNCNAPSWPSSLDNDRADAQNRIIQMETSLIALRELRDRLIAETDPNVQSDIMEQYLALQRAGALVSTVDIAEAELFIEYDLRDDIDDINARLNTAENRCLTNGDD